MENIMNKLYDLLKECKVFFIATVSDGKPAIRPFGAVTQHDGKVYICTNNKKNVYKQIRANPAIAISALTPDGGWFRVYATAILDVTDAAIDTMLNENPTLKGMYLGNPDFVTLYLKDATVEVDDVDNARTVIKF
jgi:uncharacterized pyridoxamine 5'-phosphate oxidase family protein